MRKTKLLIVNYEEDNTFTFNYAERNTPYLNEKYLENILLDLKQIPDTFLKQFTKNYLIENPGKHHVAEI